MFDFSGFPVRAVGYAGGAVLLAGGVAAAAGPATVAAVLLVGGLQLLALGVVGEYVRRIFVEVKGRPPYIVRGVVRQPAAAPARESAG